MKYSIIYKYTMDKNKFYIWSGSAGFKYRWTWRNLWLAAPTEPLKIEMRTAKAINTVYHVVSNWLTMEALYNKNVFFNIYNLRAILL